MPRVKDYTTLTQAIIDFSHRDDLAPFIDYYIQFGEQRIYRDIFLQNMGSGIEAMEEALTGAISGVGGTLAVPADYLSLKAMQVVDEAGDVITLDFKDPQWIYDNYPQRTAIGIPQFVARDLGNFIFGPSPDAGYTIQGTYYSQASVLTAANGVTWMTSECPDVLLAACMLEVGPFMKDAAQIEMWQSMYATKLAGLIAKDMADKWSGATMQIDVG
jgi:hypothetical protein